LAPQNTGIYTYNAGGHFKGLFLKSLMSVYSLPLWMNASGTLLLFTFFFYGLLKKEGLTALEQYRVSK